MTRITKFDSSASKVKMLIFREMCRQLTEVLILLCVFCQIRYKLWRGRRMVYPKHQLLHHKRFSMFDDTRSYFPIIPKVMYVHGAYFPSLFLSATHQSQYLIHLTNEKSVE